MVRWVPSPDLYIQVQVLVIRWTSYRRILHPCVIDKSVANDQIDDSNVCLPSERFIGFSPQIIGSDAILYDWERRYPLWVDSSVNREGENTVAKCYLAPSRLWQRKWSKVKPFAQLLIMNVQSDVLFVPIIYRAVFIRSWRLENFVGSAFFFSWSIEIQIWTWRALTVISMLCVLYWSEMSKAAMQYVLYTFYFADIKGNFLNHFYFIIHICRYSVIYTSFIQFDFF